MPIDYPISLPCPQAETVSPADRAQLSDPDRPREARALSLDRLAIVRAVWPPFSPVEAGIFRDWWRDDLYEGGAWFNATWPLPQGSVPSVLRFIEQPRKRFIPGGRWRLEAVLEQRGRSLEVSGAAPSGPAPTPWNVDNEVGTWTFTAADFTATSSAAGSYVVSETGVSVGDYYGELVLNFDSYDGGSSNVQVGVTTSNPGTASTGAAWDVNGDIVVENAVVDTQATLSTGDVIQVALETATGKVWLGRNGTWLGNPSARTGEAAVLGAGNDYYLFFSISGTESTYACDLRTGAAQFDFALPTDFFEWAS